MNLIHNESIQAECRRESHEAVKPIKAGRYAEIIQIMRDYPDGVSAREIAQRLYEGGATPSPERNFASPRLTEMELKGIIEVVGKKKCKYSDKRVTVYKLKEDI